MLYAQFFVDEDRYVISVKDIVEIVPVVQLKIVPMLPNYAAGLMNYHGSQVPVIDLCYLLLNRACRKKLSTRIILVNRGEGSGKSMTMGFMVEKATEMITVDESLYNPPAMRNPDGPTNGPIIEYQGELVTKISIEDVFDKLGKRFFQQAETFASETIP